MDLHVLRCPEHDLTIFWKCLSVSRSVCLSVCMLLKFCGHCISRGNARKVTKLYAELNLNKNWCWLDISRYRPIWGPDTFSRIFRYLKYLKTLFFFYMEINQTQKIGYILGKKVFVKIFVHIELQGALLLYVFLEFSDFLISYISKAFA